MSLPAAAPCLPYPTAGQAPGALNLLGLPVHPVGSQEILSFMDGVIRRGEQALIPYLNVYTVNLAVGIPWLAAYLRNAPLVFCDGDGIRLGLWMLGHRPPPKTTYNVWIWQLARWAEASGFSLYLLGGAPGVAAEAAQRLLQKHPNLNLVGTHDGYFERDGQQNEQLVDEINRLRPDILLTCFGVPIQEEWARNNSPRLAVHVLLTGGAALDYAAARVAVAPAWMVHRHLEWLFRLWLEPRRMFRRYICGNPAFLSRVCVEAIARHFIARRGEKNHTLT